MTKPLALVFYENLLPGSRLPQRLQDLGYRVLPFAEGFRLPEEAAKEKPMIILTALEAKNTDVCAAIQKLRQNTATSHIPVIAFAPGKATALRDQAIAAGANIVADEAGLFEQLPTLLEQALEIR